jgi:actin-related protein
MVFFFLFVYSISFVEFVFHTSSINLLDFAAEMERSCSSSTIDRPDDSKFIDIGNARFRVPEALFNRAICNTQFNLHSEYRGPIAKEGRVALELFAQGYVNRASSASVLPRDVMGPLLATCWELMAVSGIDGAAFDSIRRAPLDLRKDLFGHIQLSGGPSLIPGMTERLQKELTDLAPSLMKVCCCYFFFFFLYY